MGNLRVEKKLGQGSYGSVYLAYDSRADKYFVMKRIKVKGMTENEIMDCKREIEILSMLKHPNIIRYKRSFLAKGSLCILMDFAEKGDLYQIVKEQKKTQKYFEEDVVMNWFVQSCLGLQHIHSQKILHRDIKTKVFYVKMIVYTNIFPLEYISNCRWNCKDWRFWNIENISQYRSCKFSCWSALLHES
jgi:serine/threonine protein kinase